MTEDELKEVCRREISDISGRLGGTFAQDLARSMDMYLGEPLGNEQDGRSQVVSQDVQDTVESMMPDFMEMFAAGDEAVRFDPVGPEDEEQAKQATDYCNLIWYVDNEGYAITQDCLKDALIQRLGWIKVQWDDTPVKSRKILDGVNSLQLQELLKDKEIEIVGKDEREPTPDEAQFFPDGIVYKVDLIRTRMNGRVRCMAIPPENAGISPFENDAEHAYFAYHKEEKRVSDLIEAGFDADIVKSIPTGDEADFDQARLARYKPEQEMVELDQRDDTAARKVWVYECYVRVDYDDDGIAELRQVTLAGPNMTIVLDNIEIDETPLVPFTPIRMPHKIHGRSITDLVEEIQLVKTSLIRNWNDNNNLINNARHFVNEERVNIDDMLTVRPGGIVRFKGENIANLQAPIVTVPIGEQIAMGIEYWDKVREIRTGETRYNQGTDAESLNDTAKGISLIMNAAQKRKLLMARNFADSFRLVFKKILHLVIAHQDRPRTIRLRNRWVDIDPRYWNADMDATVQVGLGHGSKDTQFAMLTQLLGIQGQMVEQQGGVDGPLVKANNIYATVKRLPPTMGLRDADQYFSDPSQGPPPAPKQDPKMIEIQGKLEADKQRMAMEQQASEHKAQLEQQKAQNDLQIAREKNQAEIQAIVIKAQTERDIAIMKANLEREIAQNKATHDMRLKEEQHQAMLQQAAQPRPN